MLIVFDIGNSNITFGAYEGRKLHFVSRIKTDPAKMTDQYAAEIRAIVRLHDVAVEASGAVVCSVVPALTKMIAGAVKLCFGIQPLIVGAGIKTGLDIKIDNPAAVGADLVATAVGALEEFAPPLIIYDLGTATKATVLTEGNRFIGGMIAPGMGISMEALAAKTAQLPHIGLQKPDKVIGNNTVDCMRSGAIYGTAAMLDGMAERIEEELGYSCNIVVTGGLAEEVAGCCNRDVHLRPNLLLEGLRAIYEKNRA